MSLGLGGILGTIFVSDFNFGGYFALFYNYVNVVVKICIEKNLAG